MTPDASPGYYRHLAEMARQRVKEAQKSRDHWLRRAGEWDRLADEAQEAGES